MTAPPPIPNRPAMIPVTTPPPATAAARMASSPIGIPNIGGLNPSYHSRGGRFDRCGAALDEAERIAQHLRARAGLDRGDRKVATKRTGARHPVEQSHQMTKDATRANPGRRLAL